MIGLDGNPVSVPADTLSNTGGYLHSIHLEISAQTPGPKLTPKQRRRALKKQRRNGKRQSMIGPWNTIETGYYRKKPTGTGRANIDWPPVPAGRSRWRMVPKTDRDASILVDLAAKIREIWRDYDESLRSHL